MDGTFSLLALAIWLVVAAVAAAQPLSYSVGGRWALSENPDRDCARQYLCSSSNKTWIPQSDAQKAQHFTLFNSESACAALISRNITQIHFHGDSFMRQMYAAVLITLNGNYVNGSVSNAAGSAACTFNKQFEEKRCGVRQLNHYGIVCGGKVILDPLLNGLHSLDGCSRNNGTIALMSFGNYKIGPGGGRSGVNNATSYQQFYRDGLCPVIRDRFPSYPQSYDSQKAAICRVVWISTHARLHGYFHDETPEVIQKYNEEMRGFFDSGACGPVGYVDVYNMTRSLIAAMPDESKGMSYDQVHWGMEVNLVKAQIILNALLS